MRKMRTPGENFIVGFIWRWVTNWLTSWEHSCITHAAGKTGWMMKTSYENQKNQHDKQLHWCSFFSPGFTGWSSPIILKSFFQKTTSYICQRSQSTYRSVHRVKHPLRRIDGGPCLDPTVQWRNRRPVALGPLVSFSLTTNKWWDVSLRWWVFWGGKLSTWFASKILGGRFTQDCSIAALLSAKKPKRWHVLLLLIEARSGPVAAIFEQFVEASIWFEGLRNSELLPIFLCLHYSEA